MTRADPTVQVVQMLLNALDVSDRTQLLKSMGQEQMVGVAKMYSDREVADRYGVHVRTARRWISSGRLKGCKIESRWYSRADWLDDYDIAHQVSGG